MKYDARSQRPRPRHLFHGWDVVEPLLTRATEFAIFADFDGTLTPIRRRAASVHLAERVRDLLSTLVCHGHLVAIVSGRARDDVEQRVAIPGVWYVGDHGFLLRAPDGHTAVLISDRQQRRMAKVASRLRARLNGTPGVSIETKNATLAVHYRGAPIKSQVTTAEAVATVVAEDTQVRLLAGKKVWEVLPAVQVSKASIVRHILRWDTQPDPESQRLAIYIGDDVADEQVFASWRGLSVVVGRRPGTAARFFVRSPAEVQVFLEKLVDLSTSRRTDSPSGSAPTHVAPC